MSKDHYERLERFPVGLLAVGDAIASFNPIFAQGMAVSELEALWLHHVLAESETGIADRFFEQAATVVDLAWSLSVGPDREFPETEVDRPLPDRLVGRYVDRLQRRFRHDSALSEALEKVIHFQHPPTALFAPTVLWRVFSPVNLQEANRPIGDFLG